MKHAGNLCFYMTPANTVCVALPGPIFEFTWSADQNAANQCYVAKMLGTFHSTALEVNSSGAVQSGSQTGDKKLKEGKY